MTNPQSSHSISWLKSLRTKTLVALVAGVTSLVIALYVAGQFYLVKSFEGLEQREGLATIERVRQAVHEQENFLLTKAQDWAYWDDAYKFVNDGNNAFRTSNLTENALGNLKIHLMIYLNAKNEVVSFLQGTTEDFKPAPQTKGLDILIGKSSPYINWGDKIEGGVGGIVMLPEGPALIVSRPVITSELKGPVAGTLIFGQFLDASLIKRLSELTNLQLSLDDLSAATNPIYKTLGEKNPIGLEIGDPSTINGFTVFQDVFGKPAIGLRSPIKREVMMEGLKTISLFTNIVAGLGFLFVLLMVFVIDRAMVARLVGLSRDVAGVGPSALAGGTKQSTVTVSGDDEIALVATEINAMLGVITKNSQAMKDIVDNVSFGFMICDQAGVIQPGLTQSCGSLLEAEHSKLIGRKITDAFRMTAKDADWFMTLYGQLCEDIFPEETSLSQMPSRYVIKAKDGSNRIVRLEGRVLRASKGGSVRGILFSLTDVTDLEKAEIENREAKTLLKILEAPSAFIDFVSDMKSQIKNLSDSVKAGDHKVARRILHTLKGNFSCFGLETIAAEIHAIEDRADIVASDVAIVENLVRTFLSDHNAVLHVDYDRPAVQQYTLSEHDLERLSKICQSTTMGLEQKDNALLHLVGEFKRKPAAELLGPLNEMATQIASKLGKTVHFNTVGTNIKVDPEKFKGVSEVLPHLIRNSIDHGIETSEERLDVDKSTIGFIKLEISESAMSMLATEPQDSLVISLTDDGRGINTTLVGQRAVEMGLISKAHLETLDENQKAELIFLDALSTASAVSEISGRGFGMSAVKGNVSKLGGVIKVENNVGKGCKFTIVIPKGADPAFRARKVA